MKLNDAIIAMAGIAAYGASEHFIFSRRPSMNIHPKEARHYEPLPVHINRSEREFVIRGEKIMAHDKVTAKKIYARRHNLKKI